ncbi:MAG TPA: peptidoglycan DD-metalloendopeptidase family protein [Candidatus Polarisedimenticolia bacterium]|nr:peptidoglycan DD-metalloendopeptidase family protein [Candidatus Polarisedimenticolia bacterium]
MIARRPVRPARRTTPSAAALLVGAALLGPALHGAEPSPAPAESGTGRPKDDSDARRLAALQAQIEALRARLVAAEEQAGTILDDLDEMGLRLSLLARESEMLQREIDAARVQVMRSRREEEAARERLTKAEQDLRDWILELYKSGPPPDLSLMLLAGSPAEVAGAQRSAEALAVAEGRRVEAVRSERERLAAALAQRERQEERLLDLQKELEQRRADLGTAKAKKGRLLDDIRTRQESEEEALEGMVQMERDLTALLGRVQDPASPSRGLARFHGLLAWPAAGSVALPFGNVRHPRFHTQVPHPGLEIACDPGTEVRALFVGRVVYSDWLRGYGEMIVIDHGDEYLSIYGQLGERLVAVGQEVRQNQPIARSGTEGTFGVTGLYLEIRHRGEPEDPLPWLRQSGRRPVSRERKK